MLTMAVVSGHILIVSRRAGLAPVSKKEDRYVSQEMTHLSLEAEHKRICFRSPDAVSQFVKKAPLNGKKKSVLPRLA